MWKYKGARIQRRGVAQNSPILAAAVTIYDDAAEQGPDEPLDVFMARSHHTYRYTRRLNVAGTAFDQTPEQFQAMVKSEVKAHIDQRNAVADAAGFWADTTDFEVS